MPQLVRHCGGAVSMALLLGCHEVLAQALGTKQECACRRGFSKEEHGFRRRFLEEEHASGRGFLKEECAFRGGFF